MPSTRLILWDTHGIRVTFGYRNVTYAIQETKRFLVVRTAVFFTKTLRVVVTLYYYVPRWDCTFDGLSVRFRTGYLVLSRTLVLRLPYRTLSGVAYSLDRCSVPTTVAISMCLTR